MKTIDFVMAGTFHQQSPVLTRTLCKRINSLRATTASYNLLDHLPVDRRQPFLAPQVQVAEPVLVEPQLLQDGGVNVAEVVPVLDGVQADGVGGPDHLAALDAAAREPHGEAEVVVIAAVAAL